MSALLRLKGTESPENHPEIQIAIQPVSGRASILNFLAPGGEIQGLARL